MTRRVHIAFVLGLLGLPLVAVGEGHLSEVAAIVRVCRTSKVTTGGAVLEYLLKEGGIADDRERRRLVGFACNPVTSGALEWANSTRAQACPPDVARVLARWIDIGGPTIPPHTARAAQFPTVEVPPRGATIPGKYVVEMLINDQVITTYPIRTLSPEENRYAHGIRGQLEKEELAGLKDAVVKALDGEQVSGVQQGTAEWLLWIYTYQTGDVDFLRELMNRTPRWRWPILSVISDSDSDEAIRAFGLEWAIKFANTRIGSNVKDPFLAMERALLTEFLNANKQDAAVGNFIIERLLCTDPGPFWPDLSVLVRGASVETSSRRGVEIAISRLLDITESAGCINWTD